MLRELATLNHEQVRAWMIARSDEAFDALRAGKITKETYLSICTWAVDSYFAWVRAEWLGLLDNN